MLHQFAGNATMIVDLQFGSTGKGAIAGYIANEEHCDVVVSANMPNAGHTYIDKHGQKMVHKVLPNGIASPSCQAALIGPGAIFSIDQLRKEMEQLNRYGYSCPVYVHQNAVILEPRHAETEREKLNGIASTMQGSAAAMVEKIMRRSRTITAGGYPQHGWDKAWEGSPCYRPIICNTEMYGSLLMGADNVLLEGAQGFSLGINERFYPYCTSRDCTPARFLADMAVPLPMLAKVVGTARIHPIRVGNTQGGYSGDCYPDQEEISWDDLKVKPEKTTVTGRVRRVFSFSDQQIRDAIWATQPDEVFLNFCNYAPEAVPTITSAITKALQECTFKGGYVRYFGWGAEHSDIRESTIDFRRYK